MCRRDRLVVALAIVVLAGTAVAGDARFVPLGRPAGPPADWLTENRDGILIGSGARIYGAELADKLVLRERATIAGEAVGAAVAVGRRLLLIRGGRRLAILEDGVETTLRLRPRPRGNLTPAVMGDILVLAEDGAGLRFLQILSSHHHGHFELTPIGMLSLPVTFGALAADGRAVYATSESGLLFSIDASVPSSPQRVGQVVLEDGARALAANGGRLWVLGDEALAVYARDRERLERVARVEGLTGDAIQVNGRVVYVAGPGGVQAWEDRSTGAQTHAVTLGNDFFSPASLLVAAGDSVQWTNAALGGFHNVESCVPAINGCDGQTATESFTSGAVAGPVWSYTFRFTEPGPNEYVCISHLPFMTGVVHVGGIRIPLDAVYPILPAPVPVRPRPRD